MCPIPSTLPPTIRQSRDECRSFAKLLPEISRSVQTLATRIASEYIPYLNILFPDTALSGKSSLSKFLRGSLGKARFLNLSGSSRRDGESLSWRWLFTPPSVLTWLISSWILSTSERQNSIESRLFLYMSRVQSH